MSARTDITEQDIDLVLAVLTRRHGETLAAAEPRRESLRLALECGRWPIDEYRAVAEAASAVAKADLETVSREHAALVDVVFKADERIAALLAELADVRRVEAWVAVSDERVVGFNGQQWYAGFSDDCREPDFEDDVTADSLAALGRALEGR